MIRVLGIDDEAAFLNLTRIFLQRNAEIDFVGVSSGREALQRIAKHRFDVIVSDYMMPGMTGLEVLKSLRDTGDNTPFLLFSGCCKEEVGLDALKLGADYYLKKESDPERMFSHLAGAIVDLHHRNVSGNLSS